MVADYFKTLGLYDVSVVFSRSTSEMYSHQPAWRDHTNTFQAHTKIRGASRAVQIKSPTRLTWHVSSYISFNSGVEANIKLALWKNLWGKSPSSYKQRYGSAAERLPPEENTCLLLLLKETASGVLAVRFWNNAAVSVSWLEHREQNPGMYVVWWFCQTCQKNLLEMHINAHEDACRCNT